VTSPRGQLTYYTTLESLPNCMSLHLISYQTYNLKYY